MKYRPFGKLDWQVSALGFGCMRLPIVGEDSGAINEPLATTMIRTAIDAGVNYIDTAYAYHREQSEPLVGRVLKDGYREKVRLATKMPSWLVHSQDDMDRLLDTQLARLNTDHLDFYLLHSLNAEHWKNYQDLHVFDWAERKMAEGKFHHLGFSFHDKYEVFDSILNGYDNWTFCQIQYNYMDINTQAGLKGLRAAAAKGLAVVIMEPLRGGSLSKTPPPAVAQVFNQSRHDWNPTEWALQWLWNQPEVSLLLSGMSNLEQVQQNIASADRSAMASLSDADLALIDQVRAARAGLAPVPCTKCEYCQPCPNGVMIPSIFEIYNSAIMYDDLQNRRNIYQNEIKDENKADQCIECGQCESICPQHIEIIEWLKTAHKQLSNEGA
ncbi:MAG: aldo/keto reductase [Anaerolineaceae bacterium]